MYYLEIVSAQLNFFMTEVIKKFVACSLKLAEDFGVCGHYFNEVLNRSVQVIVHLDCPHGYSANFLAKKRE